MITAKQILALQFVYKRRKAAAASLMQAALEEINKAKSVVEKHEQTIKRLKDEIQTVNSHSLSNSITEVVQSERLLYWLRYDLEETQFKQKNAEETLKEKQNGYDQCKRVYLKAKQRLDFVDGQKRKISKLVVSKQEQIDEELFNDILMGNNNA